MKHYFLLFIANSALCVNSWSDNKIREFKDDFKFGVSTSAYQVEGAWNIDGKGEGIWDVFLHTNPGVITDGRNGDEASDSYHNYKRDVQMLRELGVDFYRFSISWPRVLPDGLHNNVNKKGLEYYENLIDELLKYNIEPMITLYHFDLPQTLQNLGGWTNPESIQWFKDYSRVIFDKFAKKVKYWITINQPDTVCIFGYGIGLFAPGIKSPGVGDYLCIKNVLLAHAHVYRLYEQEYKPKYKGSVGISVTGNWADPSDQNTKNTEAVELYREFAFGLYLHPIWSQKGGFPQIVKDVVAKKSRKQGFPKSRLPELNASDVNILKGSADFLGLNHYTTFLIQKSQKEYAEPSLKDDMGIEMTQKKEWKSSKSNWLKSVPYGLYQACIYLNEMYDYPLMYITENGWSTSSGLQDRSRADNMRSYLAALLLAIEDGTRVVGYTAWSLMDNVEWISGTSERFGLYEVDFESKKKTRTARLSALAYKRIIEKRIVESHWKPDNLTIYITAKHSKDEL